MKPSKWMDGRPWLMINRHDRQPGISTKSGEGRSQLQKGNSAGSALTCKVGLNLAMTILPYSYSVASHFCAGNAGLRLMIKYRSRYQRRRSRNSPNEDKATTTLWSWAICRRAYWSFHNGWVASGTHDPCNTESWYQSNKRSTICMDTALVRGAEADEYDMLKRTTWWAWECVQHCL